MKRVKTKKQAKNEWIGNKISELVKENYPQEQAVAISFSMYNQKHKQNGGFQASNYPIPTSIATPTLPPFQPTQQQGQQFQNYAQTLAQNNPIPNNFSQYSLNDYTPSNVLTPQTQTPLAADAGSGYQTDEQGNPMTNEKFQFFNPYLGRDPQTSAYGLGESIQNKDALGIAGNAVHLLSSLGRNAFVGAGNANREQYVMQDAMEKYREGLKPAPQSMQDGGYIKTGDTNIGLNDAANINKTTGIQFTPEFAQSYFSTQSAPMAQQAPPTDYSRMPVIDITSDGQFTDRKAWRTQRPEWFVGKQEAVEGKDYTRVPYKQWESYQQSPEYNTYINQGKDSRIAEYQDGGMAGQMPPQEEQMQQDPQQLIMQVAEAIQGGADPNQIVEQLISMGIPQESAVQLVQGIMQQMQGGAPQGQQAPPEEFEMGGTKKKSLPKLLTGEYTAEKDEVEDEEVVAEVERNEFIQRPDGEITQVLGETHQNGGVELTEEQLPENSKILSDHLKLNKEVAKNFKDLGVTTKDTYAKVLEKWTAKSGLKKIVEEQEELIKKLEAQSKLLVERPSSADTIKLNTTLLQEEIAELEKEKEPLDKEKSMMFEQLFAAQEAGKPQSQHEDMMQNGGTFNNDIIVKYAKKHGISPERANELVNEYKCGGKVEYQDGGVYIPNRPYGKDWTKEDQKLRYESFLQQARLLGYDGKLTNKDYDKNSAWGELQKFLVDKAPTETEAYAKDTRLTAKGIGNLKSIDPNIFKAAGVPVNKPNEDYSEQEAVLLSEEAKKSNKLPENFWLDEFNDYKRAYRAPMVATKLQAQGMVTPNIQTPTAVNPFLQQTQTPAPQAEVAAQKEDKFSNLDNAQRARTGLMALPNQYAQLPDALQGALKLEYRPNLMENQNITADPIVAEIRRSEQNAIQSVQNLPDEQRTAAMAQIQANTQEQLNKVMSQVQGQNLQSNAATANQNAQTLNQAQDINNRYLSDYENKIYKAQAITDADRRNYFLHNQKVNLENFNAVNKANLYNQLADNYQLTDRGLELYNSPTLSYDGVSADQYKQNLEKAYAKMKADEKKVAKAKNGGRFQKRN